MNASCPNCDSSNISCNYTETVPEEEVYTNGSPGAEVDVYNCVCHSCNHEWEEYEEA